jgi:DNA polymerase I
LLERMLPHITTTEEGLGQALLRGRYMASVARMEQNGTPIDVVTLAAIRGGWNNIKSGLIRAVDADYGVYDDRGAFKQGLFAAYLADHLIPWPVTETGMLKTDSDTFKDMSKVYPQLQPLRELKHALDELRVENLAVGSDGRNRTMLSAFRARTGRNQPKGGEFIFGPSRWLRHLIKPEPGMAVAYLDWKAQEIGIAAALSGDPFLMDSVASGDPYLSFAVSAGEAPAGASKDTHEDVRELVKVLFLASNYGAGPGMVAAKTGKSRHESEAFLRKMAKAYPIYAEWADQTVDRALLDGSIETVFGWRLHVTTSTKSTSLRNFTMQSNGAEMMRIACMLGTERGVRICCPVHDAVLIEAPIDQIDDAVATMRAAMAEAAAVVIGAEVLIGVDHKIVRYPDRYSEPRGVVMWKKVLSLLDTDSPIGGYRSPSGVIDYKLSASLGVI